MTIKIGTITFDDALWSVNDKGYGELTVVTQESVGAFLTRIGDAEDIETYEDGLMTGKWFSHGVHSATRLVGNDEDGSKLRVEFVVTTINQSAEAALQSGIDGSVDGILELANLYSSLEEEHTETRRQLDQIREENLRISKDADQKSNSMDEKYRESAEQALQMDERIANIELSITRLQDAITAIPVDILDRFSAVDNRLNALADRIAELENR